MAWSVRAGDCSTGGLGEDSLAQPPGPQELVAGCRLRYVRAGQGPAVVLVHGFGSSLATWKDVIPVLARGHEVVALDLPGFGFSDQPADLSVEDFPSSRTAATCRRRRSRSWWRKRFEGSSRRALEWLAL
jgi:pimeloyl-ACP methyl ester carboxylesterase